MEGTKSPQTIEIIKPIHSDAAFVIVIAELERIFIQ